MKLISKNVNAYYMFDHMFHFSWLIYKSVEFDVRGALDAKQYTVAYLASKSMLTWATKIYIYTCDESPIFSKNAAFTLETPVIKQLKRLLSDDHLYCKVEHLYYSCAESPDDIISEIEQIRELCYNRLISDEIWEFIGRDKEFHLSRHVEAANKIDKLFLELDEKRPQRMAFSNEMTQLIRDIGDKVKKGR